MPVASRRHPLPSRCRGRARIARGGGCFTHSVRGGDSRYNKVLHRWCPRRRPGRRLPFARCSPRSPARRPERALRFRRHNNMQIFTPHGVQRESGSPLHDSGDHLHRPRLFSVISLAPTDNYSDFVAESEPSDVSAALLAFQYPAPQLRATARIRDDIRTAFHPSAPRPTPQEQLGGLNRIVGPFALAAWLFTHFEWDPSRLQTRTISHASAGDGSQKKSFALQPDAPGQLSCRATTQNAVGHTTFGYEFEDENAFLASLFSSSQHGLRKSRGLCRASSRHRLSGTRSTLRGKRSATRHARCRLHRNHFLFGGQGSVFPTQRESRSRALPSPPFVLGSPNLKAEEGSEPLRTSPFSNGLNLFNESLPATGIAGQYVNLWIGPWPTAK